MFASRFYECLPKTLHSFGPQDLELAAVETIPGDLLESLLCTLLSLVLNRKKPVEYVFFFFRAWCCVATRSSTC